MASKKDTQIEASRALRCDGDKLHMYAVHIVKENERFQARLQVWEAEGGLSLDWWRVHNILWQGMWINNIDIYASFLLIWFGKSILRYDLLIALPWMLYIWCHIQALPSNTKLHSLTTYLHKILHN
jgi:hypothetical protein